MSAPDIVLSPSAESAQWNSPLAPLLITEYPRIKCEHPDEGRRKWLLRTSDLFWQLPAGATARLVASSSSVAVLPDDEDPLDALSTDAPELGIVVRTDFSDEDAWDAFLRRLQDAEAELAADAAPPPGPTDITMDVDDSSDDSESDGAPDGGPPRVFTVLNPAAPDDRAALSGLSNLGALRLLADVDIRRAPARPRDAQRAPPNRLVDRGGFQEVYDGKNLWIYDARSNQDQCVRVVSARGELYGTATGDSWRARASHICELQVNMATGAIQIDFGGLDRYDHHERQRNLAEAEAKAIAE